MVDNFAIVLCCAVLLVVIRQARKRHLQERGERERKRTGRA